MPCQCDWAEGENRNKLQSLADAATRAACDMRTIIRRNKWESALTLETRNWIKQHDEEDARRIEEEKCKWTPTKR
jgi:hypothetical protein